MPTTLGHSIDNKMDRCSVPTRTVSDKLVEDRLLLWVGAKAAVVPASARMEVASFMLAAVVVCVYNDVAKKNSKL